MARPRLYPHRTDAGYLEARATCPKCGSTMTSGSTFDLPDGPVFWADPGNELLAAMAIERVMAVYDNPAYHPGLAASCAPWPPPPWSLDDPPRGL